MSKNQQDDAIHLKPSRLASEEIVPVGKEDRNLRWLSFAAIWFMMTAQMGIFALGASFAEAMPVLNAIIAVLIGNFAIIIVLVLIGDIGIEHGINFAGYLRIPFGLKGSYLPLTLRALAAIAWFGIQTWLGATAIDEVSKSVFNFSGTYIWYISFGILQIAIVAAGLDVIKKVINVAAPALAILSIWLLYVMFTERSFEEFLNNQVTKPQPFIVAVVSNLSYWATVAINLPDFTRYLEGPKTGEFFKRNKHSIIAQVIGLPLGMLFFTIVGMAGFVFTGESNPVLAISALIGGTVLFIALGVVILAQLSTNLTANLFASAYAANAIGSPKVSYALGAVITGILGLLTFPWILLNFFLTYLPMIGAILAPVAAIMIVDYYIIRKRRLDVVGVFDPNGPYTYWKGINPASFIAWLIGAAAGVIWLDYSFLIAFPLSFLAYYLLMRYWVLETYHQVEKTNQEKQFLATSLNRDWQIYMDDEEKG